MKTVEPKLINESRVLLLYGGTSAEREISLKSGAAIKSALLDLGATVIEFDPAQQSMNDLFNCDVDLALIALHGRDGEDGVIQAVLKSLNIPYTGSLVASSALAMDKFRTKLVWQALGLATPEFISTKQNMVDAGFVENAVEKLGLPIFVKPAHEGSSVGMSRVNSKAELASALETAFKYDQRVLLEQFVNGREFTVTILGGQALPVIELKTPREFYDYQAKYQSDNTQYLCPAQLSEEQTQEIQQLALEAFEAVGCEGWGRVDVMLDEVKGFQLLEVNTVPGMTEKSLVPMAAKQLGINFNQLVLKIAMTSGVIKDCDVNSSHEASQSCGVIKR